MHVGVYATLTSALALRFAPRVADIGNAGYALFVAGSFLTSFARQFSAAHPDETLIYGTFLFLVAVFARLMFSMCCFFFSFLYRENVPGVTNARAASESVIESRVKFFTWPGRRVAVASLALPVPSAVVETAVASSTSADSTATGRAAVEAAPAMDDDEAGDDDHTFSDASDGSDIEVDDGASVSDSGSCCGSDGGGSSAASVAAPATAGSADAAQVPRPPSPRQTQHHLPQQQQHPRSRMRHWNAFKLKLRAAASADNAAEMLERKMQSGLRRVRERVKTGLRDLKCLSKEVTDGLETRVKHTVADVKLGYNKIEQKMKEVTDGIEKQIREVSRDMDLNRRRPAAASSSLRLATAASGAEPSGSTRSSAAQLAGQAVQAMDQAFDQAVIQAEQTLKEAEARAKQAVREASEAALARADSKMALLAPMACHFATTAKSKGPARHHHLHHASAPSSSSAPLHKTSSSPSLDHHFCSPPSSLPTMKASASYDNVSDAACVQQLQRHDAAGTACTAQSSRRPSSSSTAAAHAHHHCHQHQQHIVVTEEAAEQEEEVTCAVCLSDFQQGDDVAQLPCGTGAAPHVFHKGCIVPWLRVNKKCPLCNADIDEAGSTSSSPAAAAALAPAAHDDDHHDGADGVIHNRIPVFGF